MTNTFSRRELLKLGAGTALALTSPVSLAARKLPFDEYRLLDATALASRVRKREVSPEELLEIAIERSRQVNPLINAISVEHFELARKAIASGLPDGPLKGVPFLLKDLGVSMKGTVTTEGSRFFENSVHSKDSTIVKRYRDAGLVIFGKTHSPEFGSSPSSESTLHGETHNPWNLGHSAGGSSGGAAAAVAAGIVPVAHATDGGGSIRIPASSCGLVGLKPTRGITPQGPDNYEGWSGLSHGHVVSRSVRDSALFLDATYGAAIGDAYATSYRERPFTQELERPTKTIAHRIDDTAAATDTRTAGVRALAAEAAAKLCESLGHNVEIARPEMDALHVWKSFAQIISVGVANKISAREAQLGRQVLADELERVNREQLAAGRKLSGLQYARARDTLHYASRRVGQFMKEYDVILSPTMAQVPPALGVLHPNKTGDTFLHRASASSVFTALYNITGQPAISLPLHMTEQQLPVGVMFAARFGNDATLLRLAAQLEDAQPWFNRTPVLAI